MFVLNHGSILAAVLELVPKSMRVAVLAMLESYPQKNDTPWSKIAADLLDKPFNLTRRAVEDISLFNMTCKSHLSARARNSADETCNFIGDSEIAFENLQAISSAVASNEIAAGIADLRKIVGLARQMGLARPIHIAPLLCVNSAQFGRGAAFFQLCNTGRRRDVLAIGGR